MDERLKGYKIGSPVPEAELKRRLDIDNYVAPIIMDFATVYRINKTYMDVTDQPHLRRHLTSICALMSVSGIVFSIYVWALPDFLDDPGMGSAYTFLKMMAFFFFSVFGAMAAWSGRDELFALTRRPIRFNRRLKKLYAVRRRRFFGRASRGDIVWEIPWSKETVFCVSEGKDGWGAYYHIVCYQIDGDGNVARALAMGRRWGFYELDALLAQWNFWCRYMNDGPDLLPPPMLYLDENENFLESFFICMYTFGFSAPVLVRLLGMPIILTAFICRRLSLATCRQPKWPAEISQFNEVSVTDFNEPTGITPIGWKATLEAKLRGEWPDNPKIMVAGWTGADAQKNAQHWSEK